MGIAERDATCVFSDFRKTGILRLVQTPTLCNMDNIKPALHHFNLDCAIIKTQNLPNELDFAGFPES